MPTIGRNQLQILSWKCRRLPFWAAQTAPRSQQKMEKPWSDPKANHNLCLWRRLWLPEHSFLRLSLFGVGFVLWWVWPYEKKLKFGMSRCPAFEVEAATVSKEVSEPSPDTQQKQTWSPRNVERSWPHMCRWLLHPSGSLGRGEDRTGTAGTARAARAAELWGHRAKRASAWSWRQCRVQSASGNWLFKKNRQRKRRNLKEQIQGKTLSAKSIQASRWLLMNVPYMINDDKQR